MAKGEEEVEVRVLALRELLSSALAGLPGFPLVLGFRATDDEEGDWSHISESLPWLHTVGEQGFGTICENLRAHGLAVVLCSTQEAHCLLEIRRGRVKREYGFLTEKENVP